MRTAKREPQRSGTRESAKPKAPSFDVALRNLRSGKHALAAAQFAARVRANPKDEPSRKNHAIAVYGAGRWAKAAHLFGQLIVEQGLGPIDTVPMLFCLSVCRAELGDPIGSLTAVMAFLDLGNEQHPWYEDALRHTAGLWEALGAKAEATTLIHAVRARAGDELPSLGVVGPGPHAWGRKAVIQTCLRILGVDAKVRPPRKTAWSR